MANKAVIDTCVFIEGVFGEEDNDSQILLSSMEDFEMRTVFSQDTIGELMYILKRECNLMGLDEQEISDILFDAIIYFQKGKSTNTRSVKSRRNRVRIRDKDDQMFVDAAVSSKANHLITLDHRSGILNLKNMNFNCTTPSKFLSDYGKKEEAN